MGTETLDTYAVAADPNWPRHIGWTKCPKNAEDNC